MASIVLSSLNIVATKHNRKVYENLLKETSKLQEEVPYYGQRVAKLGKVFHLDEDDAILASSLNTYVQLDKNDSWYNEETNDAVTDPSYITKLIPPGLHPSFRRSKLLIDTRKHRIIFEAINAYGHKFSPREVAKAFRNLFSLNTIMAEFGPITVTVEPTDDAIDRILRLDRLSRLRIRLNRPNPDDHEEDEAFYDEKLFRNNAKTMETILIKDRDAISLSPDKEIRIMATVAARNGFVEGKGIDEKGYQIVESTRSHPKMKRVSVNDDLSTMPFDALFRTLSSW